MQHMKKAGAFKALIMIIFAVQVGCSSGPVSTPETTLSIAPPLNPYQSKTTTPAVSSTPTPTTVIATEAPLLPTATPFIHEVQPGDTLYGLAINYNVSLDRLVAANIGVDTSLLSIGTELVIPLSEEDDLGVPTPTPYPIPFKVPACYPTKDGDLWCLMMVENDQDQVLENITTAFNLYDSGELSRSKVAIPPLNYLYPGQSIPVSALITDADLDQFQISAVLLTALPSEIEEPFTEITDYTISYSLDNKVATITGVIEVLDVEKINQLIWISAVGLNQGVPVGVRKWVSSEPAIINTEYNFEIQLYSLGPRIDQIILLSELH